MKFDLQPFAEMIIQAAPEYIWMGYNSRPKQVSLPEPSKKEFLALKDKVETAGIPVREKELRW